MASGSDSEVLNRIAELKDELSGVRNTLNTHARPENNVSDKEFKEGKDDIKNAIKEGPDDQKGKWEALMDALGLTDVFEALKQLNKAVVVILLVGVTLALLKDRVLNYGKLLNLLVEKITKFMTGTAKIFASDERTGTPRLQTRQEAEANQAISVLPHGLTTQTINDLKTALEDLTPKIGLFNEATRRLMSAQSLKKLAKAISDLKGQLTPSPDQTIKETATAIGKLNNKLDHYSPAKLPKVGDLREVQTAAHNLSETAETLRNKFVALSSGFNTAAGSLAGSST